LFHYLSCAALLLVSQTSAAFSQQEQQPRSYIADIWQVYLTRCGLALTNPQKFLDTLPPTNTRGGPNSATTADRSLLVSSTSTDGFTVDVDIIAVSDGLNISCHVFPSMDRFVELENSSNEEIEAELEKFLVAQGLNSPSGGELKNAFSGPQDGDELEYNYVIEHDSLGRAVLTRFEMTEGDIGVYFAGVLVPAGE